MQSILVIMAVAATATAQLDTQNNINTGMNPHLQQIQIQQQQQQQMQQMQPQQMPMAPMMRQNKMMNFDQTPAFNPHRYQGPFSPQFYPTNQNTFSQQYQQQQQQQPILVMGNTIDQTQGQIQGQLPFPIQTRLLTLHELVQTPLFKQYLKYPLFAQFLPTTAFQLYLQSPLFQQYMTSPIFQMFFSDSAQFYQHVYPLLIQFQQRSGQGQGQGQPQFQPQPQPQQYQPTYTNINNNEIYPQATGTPSPYLFNQGQSQGQGQFVDPTRAQRRYINRLRKRMLWNLIMAAQQQQQQQQQPIPSPQFQPPAPLTFDPSQSQNQFQGQYQYPVDTYQAYPQQQQQQSGPIPVPVQVQMIPQAQPGQIQGQPQGQPEIVMMVVAEDQQAKEGDNSAVKPEIQRTPALERFLLEKMLRAIFLQKMKMMNGQQQEQQSEINPEQRQIFIIEETQTESQAKELSQNIPQGETIQVRPQTIPIADLRKPEGQTETETEAETYTLGEKEVKPELKEGELPTIMVRGEPIAVDTTMEVAEPQVAATNTENVNVNVDEIEGKKKLNKKMKLMKLLNANKRFTKFNKNVDNKQEMNMNEEQIVETVRTMSPEPTDQVKVINMEVMTGAEEKIINKMPVPNNDDEIMIPAPDFRARRQSQIQNQNQRPVMIIPANSPQFLQLVQMLQNRGQGQPQQGQGQGQVFYRFNNLEGQNQFLGNENQQQPSRFHYTINDQKNQETPAVYETTGARGLYSVPLTQGQPIYGNGFAANAGERYAMPSTNVNNNNYEVYSVA